MRDSCEFDVRSSTGVYQVRIGEIRASEGHWDAVIRDGQASQSFSFSGSVIELEANESKKDLSTVGNLCSVLADLGVRKNSKVLVVGGGWAQDIATMATSIYHRGISWDFAPSTLMAMADSCLGGKSSLNLGSKKNILGNFHPPSRVYVDSRFVRTLETSAIVAGLSEAVKIVFARGAPAFENFLALQESQIVDQEVDYSLVIEHSLKAKKWFVEEDEFDRGVRKLLNFGHTFAHAIEPASEMQISHGNAVLVGMLSALEFAGNRQSQLTAMLSDYVMMLARHVPTELATLREKINWGIFESALTADKKGSASEIVFILPDHNGLLQLEGFPRSDKTLLKASTSVQIVLDMLEGELR